MVRTLRLTAVPALQPQRWAAAMLLAVAGASARMAARLLREEERAVRTREFATLEVGGRTVGAVYEDGRLVAVLPEVARL